MTRRAAILSMLLWSGFAVYTFLRWTGITVTLCFFSLWLVLPYGVILASMKIPRPGLTPFRAFFVSFILGLAGSSEYTERTIVHLSGSGGTVFTYVPLLQLAAAFLWVGVFTILPRFRPRADDQR